MAADDTGEKTEHPTARRLQEAREAGRVPRSMDLSAAIGMLGGLLALKWLGGGLLAALLELTRALGEEPELTAGSLPHWLGRLGAKAAFVVLPILGVMVGITILANILQSGMPVSFKRLTPKLEKLNPVNGVQRLFSLDSVVRLGFGVLKTVVVTVVAYYAIAADIASVLTSGMLHSEGALHMACALIYKLALRLGVVLLILALLDYAYQRWNWWRNLKMTKQEVKDEYKRMEGDPLIRGRRRRAHMQLLMQRLGIDVPKSDVVVTNPTEYAVALQYDEAAMSAPRVAAKGVDLLALRIRQIAQQHGIPIVQRPPLARALYASVEVGQEVPPAYYRAVAEVLAYVYQLTGRAPTAQPVAGNN